MVIRKALEKEMLLGEDEEYWNAVWWSVVETRGCGERC
jgi:hypothetical protein